MKTPSIILVTLLLTACQSETMHHETLNTVDPHSYSKPEETVVKHLNWTATVDFDKKQISAVAVWSIQTDKNASQIIFDTKGLNIESITIDGVSANFTLSEPDKILGQALIINIAPNAKQVTIQYQTGKDAEALQWLSPQQTAGKKYPFLFTQSQAILARSWIPTQDSPGIRFTYNADVTVPKELLALMSASNPQEKNKTGAYHFEMKQPIPSYLLALAVGDITFNPISERSGVYAEPALIDRAVYEFVDLEKMIVAAEELYGPYAWGRYDVLVLPPSFPFGGMENPRLTFATPTILAGDRSLVSLIAHELAHSWSGNLVTNATWNDFWLNEGFTVYFEHRIMEKLYGTDYAEMLASLSMQELHDEIKSLIADSLKADTKLKLELTGRSPDDGMTDIAYNKGYFFLRFIEEKFGRDKFDTFLKDYFSQNAFKVMNTEAFIGFIKQYYQIKFEITLEESLFTNWIYTAGLPEDHPQPKSNRFKKVDDVIAGWKVEKELDKLLVTGWSTHEWLHFLKNLPTDLSSAQMNALDAFGNFTNTGNAEILTAWGVLAYHNHYEKACPKLKEFLIVTGRRKFLSPLYNELVKTEAGKKLAKEIYQRARPNYHYVATNTFDKLLN